MNCLPLDDSCMINYQYATEIVAAQEEVTDSQEIGTFNGNTYTFCLENGVPTIVITGDQTQVLQGE